MSTSISPDPGQGWCLVEGRWVGDKVEGSDMSRHGGSGTVHRVLVREQLLSQWATRRPSGRTQLRQRRVTRRAQNRLFVDSPAQGNRADTPGEVGTYPPTRA